MTYQTRYKPPVQIGLKQMSVLDLRGRSFTIAGLPKDPSQTSVGRQIDDDFSQTVNLQISLLSSKNFKNIDRSK